MATQKATEIREEHATELHALKITGTDHIIQKTAQAPRLTNNESNHSVVTQHQSVELKNSDVTVDASGESIVAPGPIVPSPIPTPKSNQGKFVLDFNPPDIFIFTFAGTNRTQDVAGPDHLRACLPVCLLVRLQSLSHTFFFFLIKGA